MVLNILVFFFPRHLCLNHLVIDAIGIMLILWLFSAKCLQPVQAVVIDSFAFCIFFLLEVLISSLWLYSDCFCHLLPGIDSPPCFESYSHLTFGGSWFYPCFYLHFCDANIRSLLLYPYCFSRICLSGWLSQGNPFLSNCRDLIRVPALISSGDLFGCIHGVMQRWQLI